MATVVTGNFGADDRDRTGDVQLGNLAFSNKRVIPLCEWKKNRRACASAASKDGR